MSKKYPSLLNTLGFVSNEINDNVTDDISIAPTLLQELQTKKEYTLDELIDKVIKLLSRKKDDEDYKKILNYVNLLKSKLNETESQSEQVEQLKSKSKSENEYVEATELPTALITNMDMDMGGNSNNSNSNNSSNNSSNTSTKITQIKNNSTINSTKKSKKHSIKNSIDDPTVISAITELTTHQGGSANLSKFFKKRVVTPKHKI